MSTIILGKNATVKVNSTLVGGVREITLPQLKVDVIDSTTYGTSMWKESAPGLKSGGDSTLKGIFVDADPGQEALFDAFGEEVEIEIKIANGYTYTFAAIVSELGEPTPMDKDIGFDVKLTVTGEVTRVATA